MESTTMDKYVGKFMIYDMPDFDNGYLTMDGESFIEIKEDGRGEFHFGLVTGHFDGRIKEKKGNEEFKFNWSGNDECDEASGSGYCVPNEDRPGIEGEISFRDGDDYYFYASKEG
jgi:hypothetical protein